jgi:hypothetical protein
MELSSILLSLSVIVLAAVFIGQPFYQRKNRKSGHVSSRQSPEDMNRDHIRSSLLAEKERCLAAIQELDFDHSLNKIPEDQYPVQRAELLHTAARMLQQLEKMGFEPERKSGHSTVQVTDNSKDYDELEELIAKRRGEQKKKSTGFCPRCGKPVTETDRFCPKCGTTIHSA